MVTVAPLLEVVALLGADVLCDDVVSFAGLPPMGMRSMGSGSRALEAMVLFEALAGGAV